MKVITIAHMVRAGELHRERAHAREKIDWLLAEQAVELFKLPKEEKIVRALAEGFYHARERHTRLLDEFEAVG